MSQSEVVQVGCHKALKACTLSCMWHKTNRLAARAANRSFLLGRTTQNPPIFGSWGFDPPSRHQQNKEFIVILASQLREAKIVWWLF